MRILITGGDGFIGSHLAELLIDNGFDVSLLDLKFTSNTETVGADKHIVDILNYEKLSSLIKGHNIVVHLAGVSRVELGEREPNRCIETNIMGTLNVALASLKTGAIMIFGSSREVYGEPKKIPVVEDGDKNPISIYGISKLTGEKIIENLSKNYGLRYVILRFSNVYGSPRDLPERVIPKFTRLAMNEKPLCIYGGQQILDFTFIDDVINVIKEIICSLIEERDQLLLNQDFNIVSGVGTSIFELAKLILEITGSSSELILSPRRRFDVSCFIGDPSKVKNFVHNYYIRSLKDGLIEYIRRLRERAG